MLGVVSFSSCELPLQKDEDYDGKSLDIYQHKTCWEFMEQRKDLFNSMMKAIDMCGMKDYYTQTTTQYTFLLLTEKAIGDKVKETEADPSKIDELRNILKFHIIDGAYSSYTNINYNIIYVKTLLEEQGGDVQMSLMLTLGIHASSRDDVDRLEIMHGCGSSDVVRAIASNYIMTNGPAHVLDTYCQYKQ